MVEKGYPKADQLRVRKNQVFSPVRQKWVQLTPEERVRQEYLKVLENGVRLRDRPDWRKKKR